MDPIFYLFTFHFLLSNGVRTMKRYWDYRSFKCKTASEVREQMEKSRLDGEHSIERKNNNGDYSPDNCIWALIDRQNNNKRDTIRIVINGVSYPSVAKYSEATGISRHILYKQIRKERVAERQGGGDGS